MNEFNLAEEMWESDSLLCGWTVTNDNQAEWAIRKIAEERAETQRLINVCESMILEYQNRIEGYKERQENKEGYLKSKLIQYFDSVPHKQSKTQETYKLPSGTLKLKLPTIKYERDDKILGEYLKKNNYNGYYEEVIKPKWADLKEIVTVEGDKIIDENNGNVIEGVTVVSRPPEFIVEV